MRFKTGLNLQDQTNPMTEAGFARGNGRCIGKARRERSVSAENAGNVPWYNEESREGGLMVKENSRRKRKDDRFEVRL
jgi:hypothetical protein